MKEIKLTGKYGSVISNYAQVDDEDYDLLNRHKWYCRLDDGIYYVARNVNKHTFLMHRLIMNINNPKISIDHRDGNGLNNQRSNLRIASIGENSANRRCSSKSGYLGVIKAKNCESWKAQLTKDGKRYTVYKKTKEEAALVYNEMAIKHHGEFARLNIII